MISASQIAINEQNALASKKKEQPMGIQIFILRDSRYNDENGKAQDRVAGDIHTTAYNYAKVLVESGSATFDLPAAPPPLAEVELVESGETLFTDVKGVSGTIAAALVATGATWEKLNEMPQASLTKVPGLGKTTAARLKAQAKIEVERDATRDE